MKKTNEAKQGRSKPVASSTSHKRQTPSRNSKTNRVSKATKGPKSEIQAAATNDMREDYKSGELLWKQSRFAWIGTRSQPTERTVKSNSSLPPRAVLDLVKRLLQFGGTSVCVQFDEEPFCDPFARSGELLTTTDVRVVLGEPIQCHANCATLWSRNKDQYLIATGYGLSDDGMWRRHTWLVDRDGKVIETTEPREKYFGIIMSGEGSEWFAGVVSDRAKCGGGEQSNSAKTPPHVSLAHQP